MSTENGNGKAPPAPMSTITILTNIQTGAQTIDAPKDVAVAIKFMLMATESLVDRMLRERAEAARIAVTSEKSLRDVIDKIPTPLKLVPRE